jgi:hypothetical protein
MSDNEEISKRVVPRIGDLILPKSREGKLLQQLRELNGESTLTGLGLVLDVRHPMLNDDEWTDHLIMWLDSGEKTLEWVGDLRVIASAE